VVRVRGRVGLGKTLRSRPRSRVCDAAFAGTAEVPLLGSNQQTRAAVLASIEQHQPRREPYHCATERASNELPPRQPSPTPRSRSWPQPSSASRQQHPQLHSNAAKVVGVPAAGDAAVRHVQRPVVVGQADAAQRRAYGPHRIARTDALQPLHVTPEHEDQLRVTAGVYSARAATTV